MAFLSTSRIGQLYGLTPAKTKAVFAANGLIGPDGLPTQDSVDKGMASIHISDKYGEPKPYGKWDEDAVAHLFDEASELDVFCLIRNRYQAQSKFEYTFQRAAEAFGLDLDNLPRKNYSKLVPGLSAKEINALIEASYNDPHFAGGPGAFIRTTDPTYIYLDADPIIEAIYQALIPVNKEEAIFFWEANQAIKRWIYKQC